MTTSPGTGITPVPHLTTVGGLSQFYLDAAGGDPPMLLLHGLSANANCWGAVIAAGLAPEHRLIAPDLRGRARSGKPDGGYGMADHAADIIGLIDALQLPQMVLVGHSFGGYLGIHLAVHHPDRFSRLVVIDAALQINPRAAELLKPSLDRLGRVSPSVESYLDDVRRAPHMDGVWDPHTEAYFRAELLENADGTAQSATSSTAIALSMQGLAAEDWRALVPHVTQPTLLLNAVGRYGPQGFPPLVDEANARATAAAFPRAEYAQVPGNHITMMFGEGAPVIASLIKQFVASAT